MIQGFEDITYSLTPEEKYLAGILAKALEYRRSKEVAITNDEIREKLIAYLKRDGKHSMIRLIEKKHSDVRIRKMVRYIRMIMKLPVIAYSKGYFVSDDKEEIELWIVSNLLHRAQSQIALANSMSKFEWDIVKETVKPKTFTQGTLNLIENEEA